MGYYDSFRTREGIGRYIDPRLHERNKKRYQKDIHLRISVNLYMLKVKCYVKAKYSFFHILISLDLIECKIKNMLEVLNDKHSFSVLIGSFLKTPHESDVDLILTSDFFKDINFLYRNKYLASIAPFDVTMFDLLCLTQNEFKSLLKRSKHMQKTIDEGRIIK